MPAVDLADLAAAIADAKPIDWAQFSPDDVPPDLAARARIVERIARLHAGLPAADTFSSSLPKSLLNLRDEEIVASDTPITWGPLTILEKVGRGTYGDVFRARDRRLNRDVALKLLRRKDRRESAVIEEGHLMARVRHPNVVTVYGAERIDGRVGLWMEYVDGRTLEDELRARGPLEVGDIVGIGLQLCDALAAVHGAGLLHSDLKVQNVMRDADGRVLLTDFGAGRDVSNDDALDRGLDLAGTPLYLAPEVLEGQPASPQSDIYSLDVLLFRLVTGLFPVNGRSIDDLREAHRRREGAALTKGMASLAPQLVPVIERALASLPDARFATADDLRAAPRLGHLVAMVTWSENRHGRRLGSRGHACWPHRRALVAAGGGPGSPRIPARRSCADHAFRQCNR